MKIGLSYSRCIRDIVDGKVDISDVIVIITRTDFDAYNDQQWKSIWEGYGGGHEAKGSIWSRREWDGYENEQAFRDVTLELYRTGRMHQPRQFGTNPMRLSYYWLETILPQSELDRNPMVKDAWEKFQVVAGLASVEINERH